MRDTFSITKKMDTAANCIQMGICIQDSLDKIKNMEKDLFTGSVFVLLPAQKIQNITFNNIMGYGGVDCLMEKDSIKKQMVFMTLFR